MKSWKEITNIMNLPDYADDHNYIVVKYVDGNLWFYGAYDAKGRACEVAKIERGIVIAR
jgi:hypothetical protein